MGSAAAIIHGTAGQMAVARRKSLWPWLGLGRQRSSDEFQSFGEKVRHVSSLVYGQDRIVPGGSRGVSGLQEFNVR